MGLNKKKPVPEYKSAGNKIFTLGNSDQNIDGHPIIPEGVKISSSENQIQPELKKEKVILVAEDDDFSFYVIESLLIPYNYKIIHAKNGKEAVDVFRSQEEISLVLMDIQMPVMDGFTATQEIRKIDKIVPIIAQTSFIQDKVKEKAIDSGCSDFLTKPINSDLFIGKVEKYISKN